MKLITSILLFSVLYGSFNSVIFNLRVTNYISSYPDKFNIIINRNESLRKEMPKQEMTRGEILAMTSAQNNVHYYDPAPIIDAVFTFVNGSDPELVAQMKQYGKFKSRRIRDLGQLRYAMRSVLQHAPYIRNLIVVVSSKETQTPTWLNATHPRIRVIEHKEIWDDPSNLPSMNSHAIEWAIMNIPDLSPEYLYLNDDVAITKKLDLDTIKPVPDKYEYILWEAWHAPRDSSASDTYGQSLYFVSQLFDEKYGKIRARRVASHVPLLIDRAILQKIKDEFPKEIEEMYRNKPFRNKHELQFQFSYQQYIRHHYSFKVAEEPHVHFEALTKSYYKNAKAFKKIQENPNQFLCLQDGFTKDPSPKVLKQIHNFYHDMFPIKGPWEII